MGNRFFHSLTSFKLLKQMEGHPTNNCNFLKFVISFRGGHCDYRRQAPRNLATSLPEK